MLTVYRMQYKLLTLYSKLFIIWALLGLFPLLSNIHPDLVIPGYITIIHVHSCY